MRIEPYSELIKVKNCSPGRIITLGISDSGQIVRAITGIQGFNSTGGPVVELLLLAPWGKQQALTLFDLPSTTNVLLNSNQDWRFVVEAGSNIEIPPGNLYYQFGSLLIRDDEPWIALHTKGTTRLYNPITGVILGNPNREEMAAFSKWEIRASLPNPTQGYDRLFGWPY